jgi:tryptophanyl-tRNA synthetase
LIYKAFATSLEAAAFRDELIDGMGWGDAKQRLCARIEEEMGPLRDHYADLMAHPERIEDVLQAGAQKARAIATPFMKELRQAVGLRNLSANKPVIAGHSGQVAGKASGKAARYVSFRDGSGQFCFRLVSAEGVELFCSIPFADPKQAGATMKRLQAMIADDVIVLAGETAFEIVIDGQKVADSAQSESNTARDQVIALLRVAMQPAD